MTDSSAPNKLNQQVLNAVRVTHSTVLGAAQGSAQGVAYEALAHSITLMMQNSASNQFGSKKISVASVAAACTRIVQAGASGQ